MKIEKGIPVPEDARRRGMAKYPWGEMLLGDSFFVPKRTAKNFYPTAYIAGKRRKWKFIVRNVDGGVRVWRIK